jgi:hypothetical protein
MMIFGVSIDPLLCLAVVGGVIVMLCGTHAWTEGRRFERLYGGRGLRRAPRQGHGDQGILIFRRTP